VTGHGKTRAYLHRCKILEQATAAVTTTAAHHPATRTGQGKNGGTLSALWEDVAAGNENHPSLYTL